MIPYTFKQLQEAIKFNSDFSMDKPLFVRFPANVKVTMGKLTYNNSDCLVASMRPTLLLQGSRKPTETIPVELVQQGVDGKMGVVAEGFMSPADIFFQSAREDETRLSVPPWYGNEKAYEASIELARQVDAQLKNLAEKMNISVKQAQEMLQVAKADI